MWCVIHSTTKRVLAPLAVVVLLLTDAQPVRAQRHPESSGPLSFYRNEPGTLTDPAWKRRPPFIRGPLDRHDRGKGRIFLEDNDGLGYLNYGIEQYILYRRIPVAWTRALGHRRYPMQWDRIGNYVGDTAMRWFSWEEGRSGAGGYMASGNNLIGSMIDHPGVTLRIGHYNYGPLHWTATAGTDVRSKFTSLTLDQSRFPAARLDFDYANRDKASFVFNRGRQSLFSGWGSAPGFTSDDSPVLLYGFHFEHNFSDYLLLGTSFVNQLQAYPLSRRSNAYRGDLPYEMLGPRIIKVRISDDSPEETQANARIYSVDIVLEGDRDKQRVRKTSLRGDPDFDRSLVVTPTGGRSLPGGAGREAVGQDSVIYEFLLPPDITVTSVRFVADLAGDYQVGVRQVYDFWKTNKDGTRSLEKNLLWPAQPRPSDGRRSFRWDLVTADRGAPELPQNAAYFTVQRAEGAPIGDANRGKVSFDYGMPTGQNLVGLNWRFDFLGLKIDGEFTNNSINTMFPVGANQGKRHEEQASAFWTTGTKDLPAGIEVGGEMFRLKPNFSGGYDSKRGGLPFHIDRQKEAGGRVESATQEFSLVEDNDDEDQWPDDDGRDYPGGGWPDSEVYPGLDANGDNIPDVDRNINFFPDWQEPFLMYDADPIDFTYGLDFNNNSHPDFRENDDLPDYPYPRDREGKHFFLRFNQLGNVGRMLSVGAYDMNEIAGSGQARAIYLTYLYSYNHPKIGDLELDYDVKRVQDDIRDNIYLWQVASGELDKFNAPLTAPSKDTLSADPDPLMMRDSWVHTAYLHSRFTRIERTNITNSLLFTRNGQRELHRKDGPGLLQSADIHRRLTMINKIDYTYERWGFTFRPKFKHLLERQTLASLNDPVVSYSDVIPILMVDYSLTSHSKITGGIQGFPFLPYKHIDRINKNNSFDQQDYLLMLVLRSEYWGYETAMFIGVQKHKLDYDRPNGADEDRNSTFFDVVIGY